jgi:hypothetical protein
MRRLRREAREEEQTATGLLLIMHIQTNKGGTNLKYAGGGNAVAESPPEMMTSVIDGRMLLLMGGGRCKQ